MEVGYTLGESPKSNMGDAMTGWRLYLLIVVAVLATWWAVWPEKYVVVLQAIKQPLRRTAAMRASVDRVESVFGSSKPWYPRLVRICGILMLVLLLVGYIVYKS